MAMAATSVIGLGKTVLLAKILGADDLGSYGLTMLVAQFGVYLGNWGILSAVSNQLPVALGRADPGTDDLFDRSLGAMLISSLVTAAVYLFIVLIFVDPSTEAQTVLVLAAVVTLATSVGEYALLLLRVQRRLAALGGTYLLRAVSTVLLAAGAGALLGYAGAVCAEIVGMVAAVTFARVRWLRGIRPRMPSLGRMRWLVRWGGPLMVANLIIVTSSTVDRLFVAAALPDEFGQYVFATLIVTMWLAISGIVSQAQAPQLLYELGAGLSLPDLRRKALRVNAWVAAGGGLGLAVLIPLVNLLKSRGFSEYEAGLEIMPILYAGGLLNMLSFPGFILHALKPSYSTLGAATAATVAVVGGFILTAGEGTLAQFAWLFVCSQAVLAAIAIGGVEFYVRRADRERP